MRKWALALFLLVFSTGFALSVDYTLEDSVVLEITDIEHSDTSTRQVSYTGTCSRMVEECVEYEDYEYACGTEQILVQECIEEEECHIVEDCFHYMYLEEFCFLFWCWEEVRTDYICVDKEVCEPVRDCIEYYDTATKYCTDTRCSETSNKREYYSCTKTKTVTDTVYFYDVTVNGQTYTGQGNYLSLELDRGLIEVRDNIDSEQWSMYVSEENNDVEINPTVVFDYLEGEDNGGLPKGLQFPTDPEGIALLNATLCSIGVAGIYFGTKYYNPVSHILSNVNMRNIFTGDIETGEEMAADIGISLIPVVGVVTDIRDTIRWIAGKEDSLVGFFSLVGIVAELGGPLDFGVDAIKNFLKISKKTRWYKALDSLPKLTKMDFVTDLSKVARRIGSEEFMEILAKEAGKYCDEFGEIPKIKWLGKNDLGFSPAGFDPVNRILALNKYEIPTLRRYGEFIIKHEFLHAVIDKTVKFKGVLKNLDDKLKFMLKNTVDDFHINKKLIKDSKLKKMFLEMVDEELPDITVDLKNFNNFNINNKKDMVDGLSLLSRVSYYEKFGYSFDLSKLNDEWLAILKEMRGLY